MKSKLKKNIFGLIIVIQLMVAVIFIITGFIVYSYINAYIIRIESNEALKNIDVAIQKLNEEFENLKNSGLYLVSSNKNVLLDMNTMFYDEMSEIDVLETKKEIASTIFSLTNFNTIIESSCLYIPYPDIYIYSFSEDRYSAGERDKYLSVFKEIESSIQTFYEVDGSYYFMIHNYFIEDSPVMVFKLNDIFGEEYLSKLIPKVIVNTSSVHMQDSTIQVFAETKECKAIDFNNEKEQDWIAYTQCVSYRIEGKSIYIKSRLDSFHFEFYLSQYLGEQLEALRFVNIGFLLYTLIVLLSSVIYMKLIKRKIKVPFDLLMSTIKNIEKGNLEDMIPMEEGVYPDQFEEVFRGLNEMIRSLDSNIKLNYKQQLLLKQSEFKQLQSYINPHFLYNSFANVTQLCKIGDYENVSILAQKLSLYYMYITRSSANTVSLKEEYEHANNYIIIQQIRYGNRVTVNMQPPDERAENFKIPKLIIQPLIENSYKYVFERIHKNGVIHLFVFLNEDELNIIVEDNGTVMTEEKIQELNEKIHTDDPTIEKTGLINVCKRIELLYGENASVELSLGQLKGLKVHIRINGSKEYESWN